MKKISIVCFISLIMLFSFGCSSSQNDVIGIRGEVTSIKTEKDHVVLLVEGETYEDTMYDKASVTIKADAKVVSVKDEKETPADMFDIKLSDTVEVVFEGPVAESYPVQGTAKFVRILN